MGWSRRAAVHILRLTPDLTADPRNRNGRVFPATRAPTAGAARASGATVSGERERGPLKSV